jgi:ketosteroid isomerase-like protein
MYACIVVGSSITIVATFRSISADAVILVDPLCLQPVIPLYDLRNARMKLEFLYGAAVAACVSFTHSGAQPATSPAVRAIEPLLNQQMQAANAHDTDRFLAAYVHDSTFDLVFNGQVIHGFAAVRAQQLQWWNNGQSDVVYTERAPAVFTVVSPSVVLVIQELSSRRTLPTGGTAGGDFVATTVWQKRSDGWRVVQAHESTAR